MNKDRIRHLADIIEAQPYVEGFDATSGFNMDHWVHNCGAPSCIAGWAAHLIGYDGKMESEWIVAQRYLELTDEQGDDLFFARGRPSHRSQLKSIQPNEAALVLRNLAETGRVDWSII